jgi:CSLREA domain-containing protein
MKRTGGLYRTSLAGFILALLVAVSAQSAPITVNSSADAGGSCPGATCTLRQAIATAAAGETINFAAGITTITLTSNQLSINKSLTIDGPGANQLTVRRSTASGTVNFRIFDITSGNVIISGITVANGAATTDYGGGVHNSGAPVSITNATIAGNTGKSGGIYNDGTLTITNSTVSGNMTTQSGAGGGIFNLGTLTVIDSTISGNTSIDSFGGAVFNNVGQVTITSSTISGNMAPQGYGGGLYDQIGTMTITSSTITANSAKWAGGIANGISPDSAGVVNLRNTIIARNTASAYPDVFGPFATQGFNLVADSSGATISPTVTTDQIGADPLLGPLQDNSGPTFTHALLPGSAAIDRGDSSGLSADQRGFARPVDDPNINNSGDGSDVGAYEVQPCNTINGMVKNNDDSGTDSLRAVINTVCDGGTITFASNVRGAINLTSGELLVNKNLTINGPGANLLSVQRSAASGTPNFRIFNISGTFKVSISGLTLAKGKISAFGESGGGILNQGGTLTLTNSTVSGNSASIGGGIQNTGGTLNLTSSTISGNSAGLGGGGVIGGTVSIINSTISGNMAKGGNAGGIAVINVTLTNSTISGNSASGSGGGVFNNGFNGASIQAKNTIIALNTAASGPDVNGALNSDGFNLIGDGSGASISPASSDQIGVSSAQLNLGSLQDNGGPTRTRALLSGSFAIDKGNSSGSFIDQRGFIRPVGSASVSGGDGSDIGAFEFGAQPLRITSITRLTNGHIALQAIGIPNKPHTIHASPDLSPKSFVPLSATANGTGVLQYDDSGATGLTKRFYRISFP